MLCAIFGWNCPSAYGEKEFLNFALSFSPLEKGCGPSFEQPWIPFTQPSKFGWNLQSGSGKEDF